MKTSLQGLELIKEFESLELEPYLDPVGIPTIGWGHTEDVSMDMPKATLEQAEAWLKLDLAEAEKAIGRYVKLPLKQNQFDALASFVFNVGSGNFRASTLLRRVNENRFVEVAQEFGKWVYSKGKRLKGLERRRLREAELFLS